MYYVVYSIVILNTSLQEMPSNNHKELLYVGESEEVRSIIDIKNSDIY